MPLAERVHEFLQSRRSLDLEKDLVVVVGNLDIEMFADLSFRLLGRRAAVVVRHFRWKVSVSEGCVKGVRETGAALREVRERLLEVELTRE